MAIGADRTGQASQPGTPGTDEATRPRTGQIGRLGAGESDRHRPGLVTSALARRRVPGTGGSQRWFFAGIWLVYLVSPVADLFGHGHGVLWIAGGLAITVAFCVIYLITVCNSGSWPRQARWGLIAIAVLAALACVVYGQAWTPLWIYVSAATGMVLAGPAYGRGTAWRGVLAVCACYVFFSWLTHAGTAEFLAVLLPVLLVGVVMIGFREQIQLMNDLTQARETVARLAANEERLRLARDMHDLTGQSLSTITLKSELAAKRLARLPESAERDMVLGDLGDIGRVSRQTLHDIREAVSGYRRPTLAIEVIAARNALDTAAISLDDDPGLTLRSGTFDPDAEAVLAWCLREAVTNVIRHSGARSCRIRLTEHPGELSLEITDDGRGLPGPAETSGPSRGADAPDATQGAGLRGMSERLSAVGGRLSVGSADRGFRLTATVPVDPDDT
jgi:two-component system, NarL family, sensor histidine kinase DesK